MTVEGAVEARNDRGIKLGGEWRNMSKFRPVALPEIGAHVRADVDDKGFLKAIEVLDEPTPAATASVSHRDQQIARLAVLKAAAAYAAVRPTMKAADVLTVADRWLEWVQA
jgi:hypothetical protein